MASNYPGSLDSFNNPSASTEMDATGYEHDLQHANINDAVEAIQGELGTDPAGTYSTVKDRLDALAGSTKITITEKTSNYTLALADRGTLIYCNSSSAINITVPPQSSVTWEAGQIIEVMRAGTGDVTIVEGSGVTVNSASGGLDLSGQWTSVTLLRVASDVWVVIGDVW